MVSTVKNLKAYSEKEGVIKVTFDSPEEGGPFKYIISAQNVETGEYKYKRVFNKNKVTIKRLAPGYEYEIKVQTRVRNPKAKKDVISNKNVLRSEWVTLNENVIVMGDEVQKKKETIETKTHLLISPGDKIPPYAIGEPFYVKMVSTGVWEKWENPEEDLMKKYVEENIDFYEENHEELLEKIEEMEADAKMLKEEDGDEMGARRVEYLAEIKRKGIPESLNTVMRYREQFEREAKALYMGTYPMPIPNPEETLGCGVLVPKVLKEVE